MDEVARVLDAVKILADPIERLQIAQPALAVLDVGLDEIAALALAAVAFVALGKLGFDEVVAAAGRDITPEFLLELVVQFAVAPEIARFQKRRADGEILLAEPHTFR